MSEEVQLLRHYLDATVDPDHDLAAARGAFLEEMDLGVAESQPEKTLAGRRTPWRRPRVLVTAMAVAALIAALLIAVGSGSHGPTGRTVTPPTMPAGAVAQLRLIADRAVDQPIPRLTDGQLLLTRADLSVAASVNNGAAQATIGLSVQKWSTATGQTCVALTAQPAQFASPTDQTAWTGLGLRTLPQPPTAYQCLQGGGASPPDAITGAGEAIDVSSLPTDPSALAQELEASTTGIPALDQLTSDLAAPNLAFQRAAMILIGPVVGATAQFDSALYRAVALIPGVVALGTTPTHDGESGEGFASGPGSGQTTIVVDPMSGQLLEVSGLDDSDSLTAIAVNYLNGGPMQVDEYSAPLQWLDPVGSPTVVSESDLPTGLPTYVFAVAKSGVTVTQLEPLFMSLEREYANTISSFGEQSPGPPTSGSPVSWQWSFNAPPSGVTAFTQALQSSGLIQTVIVI
jgi:hypothetical protein